MNAMGEKIKDLRVNLGWNMRMLSAASGVDIGTISHAETGRRVTAVTAKKLADAFSKAYGRTILPTDIVDLNIG
jgi:transcriptional regulator with XRE-family HTH domain